jgi:hypothetical protein
MASTTTALSFFSHATILMPRVPPAHRGRRHAGHCGSSGTVEQSKVRVRVTRLAANLAVQRGKGTVDLFGGYVAPSG